MPRGRACVYGRHHCEVTRIDRQGRDVHTDVRWLRPRYVGVRNCRDRRHHSVRGRHEVVHEISACLHQRWPREERGVRPGVWGVLKYITALRENVVSHILTSYWAYPFISMYYGVIITAIVYPYSDTVMNTVLWWCHIMWSNTFWCSYLPQVFFRIHVHVSRWSKVLNFNRNFSI